MSRSAIAYRMPIAAVAAPAPMVTRPGQVPAGGASRKANSAIPYTPIFTTTPDRNADPSAGATGWASGEHTCSGTQPALKPKPISASGNAAARQPPGTDAASAEIPASVVNPVFDDRI